MGRRKREASEDPERATLEAVLATIHRVNPTARGLSPAETERRYAEKSTWQSALIRRFAELIVVQREPDSAVVGLRLQAGRPAGHARIDALDETARAWVRAQLDLDLALQGAGLTPESAAPWTPPANPTAQHEGGPESALADGQAALAEYDYPAAEAAFRQALPLPGAALGLLALYVDCLADDEAARALWLGLPPALQALPGVRIAVATAASRLGDRGVTEAALGSTAGPRAAKAWVRLGHEALGAGDVAQAQRDLAACRRADPNLPAGARLLEAIETARATLFAPREAALLAAWDARTIELAEPPSNAAAETAGSLVVAPLAPAGDADHRGLSLAALDTLEARARTLLAEHPGSGAARQVLAGAARVRQGWAHSAALARAKVARVAGAPGAAAAHLRAAIAALPEAETERRAALRLEAETLEAEALSRASDARCSAVRAALGANPGEEGLLAWLGLSVAERAVVSAPSPVGDWLVALSEGEVGRASPKAAVRAALALRRAQAHAEAGEGEAARAALQPHARVLAGLPAAAEVVARLAALEAAARESEVALCMADAEAALATGKPEVALDRLLHLPREGLPADGAARVEALTAQAREAHQRLAWQSEVEARVSADDLLGARAALSRLMALDPEERRWRARRAALDVAVAKAWQHTVLHPHAADGLPDAWWTPAVEPWGRWMTPDGGHAVVASTQGRWLLLRWLAVSEVPVAEGISVEGVSPAEGVLPAERVILAEGVLPADAALSSAPRAAPMSPPVVTRAVVLRLPRAVTAHSHAVGSAGVRWVDGGGGLLSLSHGGAEILGWQVLRPGLGPDAVEEAVLLPDHPSVWLSLSADNGLVSEVVDASNLFQDEGLRGEGAARVEGPVRRIERVASQVVALAEAGARPESVAAARVRGPQVDVHGPNGRLLSTQTFAAPVRAVAGSVASLWTLCAEAEAERFVLVLRRPGHADVSLSFEGDLRWPHGLLPAADGHTVYLHHRAARGHTLRAVTLVDAPEGPRLEAAWQVPAPERMGLLAATGGAHPCVYAVDEIGPTLLRLESTRPPPLRALAERPTGLVPSAWNLMPCGGLSMARRYRLRALVTLLRGHPAARRRAWVEQQLAGDVPVDEAVELFHAVCQVAPGLAETVAERARSRFPQSAQVRLLHADRAARAGQWGRVGVLLSDVRPDLQEADHAAHYHHLLGLSLLQAGAGQGARQAWREGLGCDAGDPCGLSALLRSVDAEDDDEALSDYALRVRLIARADAARAAGDFSAVITVLDHLAVWRDPEAQSFARLTEAVLETPAHDDESWLRKLRAVAGFLWLTDPRRAAPPGWQALSLPAERWDAQRIADLRAKANWWLSPGPASC